MLSYLYDDYESSSSSSLRTLQNLASYSLLAADGEIGRIRALFFDDATGAIRYLMVASTSWLQGQPVLISPVAVGEVSDKHKTINIELTREQIASAPHFNPHTPVMRSYEQAYFKHYNWPPYWEQVSVNTRLTAKPSVDSQDDAVCLCSSQSLTGVDVVADRSIIGQLEHMVVDIQYWQLRYLGVTTCGFVEDKTLLINLAWIEQIDLQRRRVSVNMYLDTIQHAPSFHAGKPISRAYEKKLFNYHRRQPYWL